MALTLSVFLYLLKKARADLYKMPWAFHCITTGKQCLSAEEFSSNVFV